MIDKSPARLELFPNVRRRGGRSDALRRVRRERIAQRRGTATATLKEKFSTARATLKRAPRPIASARIFRKIFAPTATARHSSVSSAACGKPAEIFLEV